MDSSKWSEITERPFWLTEEYITEVLRKGEGDPEITIGTVDATFSLGKGENYLSVIQKFNVSYCDGKGNHVKKGLIIKLIPQNPVMQRLMRESKMFDIEIHAYSKLLPTMASLTKTPLVSAKYYPTEREDAVIMEDMSCRGFKSADRKERLDMAHIVLALQALAQFHGLSYGVVEREPAIVDHFPESTYSSRMKEANLSYMPYTYEATASTVETWPGYETFAEKIRRRVEGLLDQLELAVSPKKGAFNVLNHGDCWVNNMLFRYKKDSKKPEEVCLIDFQSVRYGSPALDLQHFFVTSLADGIREEHEETLLEMYHKELSETLKSVALKPVTYTLEDLKHDFQEKAAFGFDMACSMIGIMVADSNDVVDLNNLTEDSVENGSVDVVGKTIHGKEFKNTFQKILRYYEDKGVI